MPQRTLTGHLGAVLSAAASLFGVRRRVSIGTKLGAAVGSVMLLGIAFAILSLYQLHAIKNVTSDIRDIRMPQLEILESIKRLASEHELLATRRTQTTNFHYLAAISSGMERTEQALGVAERSYAQAVDDPVDRDILAEFRRHWTNYLQSLRDVAARLEAGEVSAAHREFEAVSVFSLKLAMAELGQLVWNAKRKSQQGTARAELVYRQTFALTVLAIVIAIFSTLAVSVWVSRRVTQPVLEVSAAMRGLIADGDKVATDGKHDSDEIEVLIAAAAGYRDALVRSRTLTSMAELDRERLQAAMNNMSHGLCFFDGQQRLVLCNDLYLQMYGLSREMVAPGATLREIVELRCAVGSCANATADEFLAWWKQNVAAFDGLSEIVVELTNGRVCRVRHRPMPDGGWVATHEDITATRERDAMFRLMFENNPVPMWVFDQETLKFLAVNDAVVRRYGYTREQFLEMTVLDIRPPEDWDAVRQHVERIDATRHHGAEWRHIAADGSPIDVETYGKSMQYEGRRAVMVVVIDITDRKLAQQRIAHGALHDALTDLPNRTALDRHFGQALEHGRATGTSFAVLCIDLDRFKEINDLCGHSVGDEVLREVSRRLRAACAGAFLARIGGDEFIAISSVDGAATDAMVERLKHTLNADVEVPGHSFELDLSIGIAVFPKDGADATTLVANADAALYRAKKDGKGAVRYFTAAMDQQLRERRNLERDLRAALERGEISLEYQPQADAEGTIVGFEALARWNHPLRGRVPPAEFIPVAEESGFIVELGEWVLREACHEAARWLRPLRVAVNVSGVQFRRGNLQRTVHAILIESGLSPERLELEITEGVLIENVSRAAALLRSLKSLGVLVALDDFGTGYSSLSYLQSFPLDRIKIDRSFVTKMSEGNGSLAIVRGVIGLAHGLRLPVLAEGVETAEQLALLSQEGCDEAQGYLIGRPQPIDRYAEVVGYRSRPANLRLVS